MRGVLSFAKIPIGAVTKKHKPRLSDKLIFSLNTLLKSMPLLKRFSLGFFSLVVIRSFV